MAAVAADRTSALETGTAVTVARTASHLGTNASSAARPSDHLPKMVSAARSCPPPNQQPAHTGVLLRLLRQQLSQRTTPGWVSLWLLCGVHNRRRELHGLRRRRRRRPGVPRRGLELPRLQRPQLCVAQRVLQVPRGQVKPGQSVNGLVGISRGLLIHTVGDRPTGMLETRGKWSCFKCTCDSQFYKFAAACVHPCIDSRICRPMSCDNKCRLTLFEIPQK